MVLYIVLKIGAIASAPILKPSFGIPSGPAAFLFLRFFKDLFFRYVVQIALGLRRV